MKYKMNLLGVALIITTSLSKSIVTAAAGSYHPIFQPQSKSYTVERIIYHHSYDIH